MIGDGGSDFGPFLSRESLQCGRKEISFFPHHVAPLAYYKVAYDIANVLPSELTIREDGVNSSREAVQTVDDFLVFKREIADDCSCIRIASLELGKNQVFLWMMVHLGVNFEIADNRANDLIIGTDPFLKNLQFALESGQKQINVAMLSKQKIDDHCGGPGGTI
ncbi:hypothetical protein GA0061098_103147 [Bradyrhizobium shewense]|uniref:Uncharacterized protein n=1 Tax=Bradyrhizobium shewense TaxID=1761772 RepID=A0A1C3XRL2_9BRAD|nr:hypothetical protein GA0061098_103147 [Bradyrhizobium shewense]